MVQWVWLINYYILYQLFVIVFQTLGMLDVFMTTYNFPVSLYLYAFNARKTPQVNIVDILQDNVSAFVFLPGGANEIFWTPCGLPYALKEPSGLPSALPFPK